MKTNEEWVKEWNDFHTKYIKEGSDIRNTKMADYCEKVIEEAKKIYYTTNKSIMTDNMYDRFEDSLRILRPDSKILKKVGHDI